MAKTDIQVEESAGYRNEFSIKVQTEHDLTVGEVTTIYTAIESIASVIKPRLEKERQLQAIREKESRNSKETK